MLLYKLLFLGFYTYFGYFLLVIIFGKILNRKVIKKNIEPNVTLMIAAYNEEQGIAKKIENSLALDYPSNKLKIIVVSDGSTDKTDEIVRSYEDRGIILYRVEGRVGKTEARNIAIKSVPEDEIVLFSDATTTYKKDIIKKLVQNFADPEVGMVTGQLIYQDDENTQMGLGQKLYWKYESLIKKCQTSMGTLTGSVGCVTAFRRKLYTPLPRNIIEDFTEPLMIVMKGYRVVYEEKAICFEETTRKSKKEWVMRVRVIRGGMTGMLYAKKVLNPFLYPLSSFQLISHKVLRWLVPVLMIAILLENMRVVLIHSDLVLPKVLMALQGLFYLATLIAYVCEKRGISSRITAIPFYFFVVNMASLVAIYKTVTDNLDATWEPERNV